MCDPEKSFALWRSNDQAPQAPRAPAQLAKLMIDIASGEVRGGLCGNSCECLSSDSLQMARRVKVDDHGDYHDSYGDHYVSVSVGPFEYGHSSLAF